MTDMELPVVAPKTSLKLDTQFNIQRKVFVGNVSYRIRSRKLAKFFSKFGSVEHCYIVKDHLKGWSRGIAFITFENEDGMTRALQASDQELYLDARQMRVQPSQLSSKTWYLLADSEEESEGDGTPYQGERTPSQGEGNQSPSEQNTQQSTAETFLPRACDGAAIDMLFEEVMVRILSLLSWKERVGVERVCWRWKHLVQRTWSSVHHLHFRNIFKGFGGLTDKNLGCLLSRCGSYLTSLDVAASPRILTTFAMDVIGKHCPSLQELDLTSVKVTDISLKNLVSRCTNLRRLWLRKCFHVTDKGVRYVLSVCSQLAYLDLSDMPVISGQCFKKVSREHSALKSVILTNNHSVSDAGMSQLVSRCSQLEELNISNCLNISSATHTQICQTLSNLRVLNAAGIKLDESAVEVIGNLHALEDLNISFSRLVLDLTLISLAQGCHLLRDLDVSGCASVTDIGVMSLAQLPRLTSLNLSYLSQVTEDSVMKIAQAGHLKKLVARATKFTTDDAIIALVTLCPLEHLDVSGCFQITMAILPAFKNTPALNGDTNIQLIIGGTSIDLEDEDMSAVMGLDHVTISMHNLVMRELEPDRDIILPSYDGDEMEDEDDSYSPHLPIPAYQEHVDFNDDWDDDYYGDGYLDNDDPLELERWSMS
ncbi:F-box/LRR-repeat protein fbxl-1-like isoform X2 [Mya arenaria]|nr:F-box/LRR-repeat protein fbxl-1-like isoform X2 [Mya arenaria]